MRLSVQILLAMIFVNAAAVYAIPGSGVDDHLGVQPEPGNPQELQTAEDKADDFNTGQGLGQTLFGMYNALAGVLNTFINAIFPAAEMLKNAGVPDWGANFLFAGATLYSAFDLIGFLRSGGLTE